MCLYNNPYNVIILLSEQKVPSKCMSAYIDYMIIVFKKHMR